MKSRVLAGSLLAVVAGAVPAMAATANNPSAGAAGSGAVFTLDNQAQNAVQAFSRAADGTLTSAGSALTGGAGTGGGLGSQGALVLEGDRLAAIDAASNEVAVFDVNGTSLHRTAHVASGGVRPISATIHDDLLYVLNEGAPGGSPGNITGFRINAAGEVTPIAGSTQPLSAADVGPAQLQFSPDGRTIVVTEKTTNTIDTYAVDNGVAATPVSTPSAGITPFGFDFNQRGQVIVADAGGGSGVSSYSLIRGGGISPITGFLPGGQAAACWLVTTNNGRFAFSANTGSGTISSFAVGGTGRLTLVSGAAASVGGPGSAPIDVALSAKSRYLYSLNRDPLNTAVRRISAFRVGDDGSLGAVETGSALPAGTVGVAAS